MSVSPPFYEENDRLARDFFNKKLEGEIRED